MPRHPGWPVAVCHDLTRSFGARHRPFLCHPGPGGRPQGLCSLGALAAGLGLSLLGSPALAQTAPDQAAPAAVAQTAGAESTLPTVSVKGKLERPEAKTSYQAVTTRIGKGNQALRDIPQITDCP